VSEGPQRSHGDRAAEIAFKKEREISEHRRLHRGRDGAAVAGEINNGPARFALLRGRALNRTRPTGRGGVAPGAAIVGEADNGHPSPSERR